MKGSNTIPAFLRKYSIVGEGIEWDWNVRTFEKYG
jgi:hypothetical protein